jgi:hypothetical protein
MSAPVPEMKPQPLVLLLLLLLLWQHPCVGTATQPNPYTQLRCVICVRRVLYAAVSNAHSIRCSPVFCADPPTHPPTHPPTDRCCCCCSVQAGMFVGGFPNNTFMGLVINVLYILSMCVLHVSAAGLA